MVRRFFPKVTALKDANAPAIVEVTPTDNQRAEVKNHQTCALALACMRYFKADGVIIGLTTSWIVHGLVATRYQNAATISREITSFDRNAGFDEGLYLLSPASAGNRLGMQRSKNPHRKASRNGKPRAFRHFTRNVRTSLLHPGI